MAAEKYVDPPPSPLQRRVAAWLFASSPEACLRFAAVYGLIAVVAVLAGSPPLALYFVVPGLAQVLRAAVYMVRRRWRARRG